MVVNVVLHSVYGVILDIFDSKFCGIGAYFISSRYFKDDSHVKFNTCIQTTIY